jgi:hypothetical protein
MVVRIEFQGGCRDGAVVFGVDALDLGFDKNPAHAYLRFTEGGRIGAVFREPVSEEFRQAQIREYQKKAAEVVPLGKPVPLNLLPPDYHVYKVTERRVEKDAVVIRLEYIGEESKNLAQAALETWDASAGRVSGKRLRQVREPLTIESIDDFRVMLVDPKTAQLGFSTIHSKLPLGDLLKFPMAKKRRPLSARVERRVGIIDAMTAAERRHPESLIDQLARARIAKESGTSRQDVDQLLYVFGALKKRSASPGNFENLARKRPSLELPELSDLSELPVRACIAFAVRCTFRACLQLEPSDEEVREAIQVAIEIAAGYAAGNAIDNDDLSELSARVWLADRLRWPNGEECPGRHAVTAATWAMLDASFAAMFEKSGYPITSDRREFKPGQSGARWAAKESIAADDRNVSGVLADLQLLRVAIERGDLSDETPVPQTIFPAISEPPPGASPTTQL